MRMGCTPTSKSFSSDTSVHRSGSRRRWKLFLPTLTLHLLAGSNEGLTTFVDRRPELNLIDHSSRYKEINQRSENGVFDETVPKFGVCELVVRSNPLVHKIHPLPGLEALSRLYSSGEEKERSTMKQTITVKEARAWVGALRLELLRQKRAVGDPRAPMRAQPGKEEAFEKVEADLTTTDFILKLLEKEERRARAEAVLKLKRRAVRAADVLLNGAIIFGLVSVATLGFSAAAVLLNFPDIIVQGTALIGVGIALAQAVVRK